jgi:ATP synthase F1 epsilon subunit
LPNHSALISTLRAGVIKIYTDKETKKAFVASGIAEVNPSSCTVLAEKVIDLDKITRPEAEKMLLKAKDRLEKAVEDAEKSEAIREVEASEALMASL